ncbi:MAG: hypothetical protein EOP09_11470 [Proteobacteria bacterium]|nr:MAG: hypothetical protein EOP09_11470 [Pseudomonadota bacterium]
MKCTAWIFCSLLIACSHATHLESRPNVLATLVGSTLPSSSGWLQSLPTWHINSPLNEYSIRVITQFQNRESPTLRFEMREGDTWTGPQGSRTFRNELIPGTFPNVGGMREYSCSIFLPSDFPIEDNRLVLMQWWPQAKTELGEEGRSPSLALRFVNGEVSATIRHSPLRVIRDPDQVAKVGLFRRHLQLGTWQTFKFRARWSHRDDGLVQAWLNGELLADYHGPVGYSDDQGPLFKFGMYRNDSKSTYVAYFSDCSEQEGTL